MALTAVSRPAITRQQLGLPTVITSLLKSVYLRDSDKYIAFRTFTSANSAPCKFVGKASYAWIFLFASCYMWSILMCFINSLHGIHTWYVNYNELIVYIS
jgi:hypothetical protein